jgi:tRNA threonylcarbamoyladenosine biosynthesis protein TsaB
MLTLAVDTTADWGSIALADDSGVREEVLVEAPRGFSHVLFGAIEALLERQGVRLADIGLFAGASGPGSFTGVRVGLAAIKGLAETLGKPALAVSNLEAMRVFGTARRRAVVIDAHRTEVFAALFDDDAAGAMPESVLALERFVELAGEGPMDWISQDDRVLNRCPAHATPIQAPRGLAAEIARFAVAQLPHAGTSDPAAIEANYVRRSDAEIFWKED